MQVTHSVWHPGSAQDSQEAAASDPLLPTVIAIHGHGAHSQDLLGLAPYLASGRLLMICPEAEFMLQPGMPSYTWFEPSGTDLRRTPEEFERVVARVSEFIAEAVARYGGDSARTVILGFSQGGSLAYRLGLAAPAHFAGVAALSTWLPDEAVDSASTDTAALAALPVLVQHGTADQAIEVTRARESRDRLQTLGVQLEYHEYGMAHQIGAESLADLSAWCERVLALPALAASPTP
ncbi:MAG: alpha/beta hydrolase-fold protein [Chloroflexi bacterium]|nr:alpha/beta hydrolase-fold protein [Chloroflexota bacterium]MDA1147678.1 alpha/beta hydrolase-fold protein [Chloroflexota bacterium]